MALGEGFRNARMVAQVAEVFPPEPPELDDVEKAFGRIRRVKTLRGVKVFGQPIGTIITRDMIERAIRQGKLRPDGSYRASSAARGGNKPKQAGFRREAKRLGIPSANVMVGNVKDNFREAGKRVAAARAGGAKAPAPRAGGSPASKKRRAEVEALVSRASFKQLQEIVADIENDTTLDDADYNSLIKTIEARSAKLRPNKAPVKPKARVNAPEKPAARAKAPAKAPERPEKPAAKAPAAPRKAPEKAPAAPKKMPSLEGDFVSSKDVTDTMAEARKRIRNGGEPADLLMDLDGWLEGGDLKATDRKRVEAFLAYADRRMGNYDAPEPPKKTSTAPPRKQAAAQQQAGITPRALRTPATQPEADGPKNADQEFMAMRKHIDYFERALQQGGRKDRIKFEADLIRSEINSAKFLNDGQKNVLLDQLKEIQNPKVPRGRAYEAIKTQIEEASFKHELNAAFTDLTDPDSHLTPDEEQSLADQIEQRAWDLGIDPDDIGSPAAALDPNQWDTHPDKVKPPVTLELSREQKIMLREGRKEKFIEAEVRAAEARRLDPDNTPAGRQIENGTPLDQVTNPDGMMEYINAHPERFQKTFTAAGQGGAFTVWDKRDDRDYFFKETNAGTSVGPSGYNVRMFGEAVNEIVSGKIGQAFPDWFPDVDFAETPTEGKNPSIRMRHMSEIGASMPDFKRVHFDAGDRWEFNLAEEKLLHPKAPPVRDPRNPLAIHIFDFLANSTDRHDDNYGVVEHTDGTVSFIALDNGGAFHGFDSFINSGGEHIPRHFVDTPESVGYAEFAHVFTAGEHWAEGVSRGHYMAREMLAAIKHHNLSEKDVEKMANEIIQAFASRSMEEIKADLLARFPNLPTYERAHLESAARMFQSRLRNISAKDVARFFTEYQKSETRGQR